MNRGEALAYAAGLVDADGCTTIQRRGGRQLDGYAALVRISQNVWPCITFMKEHFGGSAYARTEGTTNTHSWSLHGRNAIGFLEEIIPYLVLKKAEAEIVLEMARDMKPRYGSRGYKTKELNKVRDGIYKRFQEAAKARRNGEE